LFYGGVRVRPSAPKIGIGLLRTVPIKPKEAEVLKEFFFCKIICIFHKFDFYLLYDTMFILAEEGCII